MEETATIYDGKNKMNRFWSSRKGSIVLSGWGECGGAGRRRWRRIAAEFAGG